MRRQIQKAIDMKDPEMLERYIVAYENLNPPYDDDVLLKARKMLAALDAKEGKFTTGFLKAQFYFEMNKYYLSK